MKKKTLVINIIIIIVLAIGFAAINFFNVNPMGTTRIVNSIIPNISEYQRDFMFSISSAEDSTIPSFEIKINELNNRSMSETRQQTQLFLADQSFIWDKLYKFDTLISKTPYDSRYVKFEDFKSLGLHYEQRPLNSLLMQNFLTKFKDEPSLFNPNLKFSGKKMFLYKNVEFVTDRIKFDYTMEINEAQDMFDSVFDSIWNSPEMKSFFIEDDKIQEKLAIENNTKEILNIINDIKTNITVKSLTVDYTLNLMYPEFVMYSFDCEYNSKDGIIPITITFSEYLSRLATDFSPEENFSIGSMMDFESLK